jgi:release factor glutamine methyltransferase
MAPRDDARPSPTIAEQIASATKLLAGVTDTPRLDAEILLARAVGVTRSRLLAMLCERCSAPGFPTLIERRLNHEPLAYILGEWEFFSLAFKVVPPLLVPRPETEHLVEAVVGFLGEERGRKGRKELKGRKGRVLELGTGTGCVAIAVAKNLGRVEVVATDLNPLALETAAENARRHAVEDRIQFRQGDLFDALQPEDSFDVVCSNPPYIEEGAWGALSPVIRLHEDPRALLAGKDGLDVIRALVAGACKRLRDGGLLAFEIGEGQAGAVRGMLEERGYAQIGFVKDLAGIDRIARAEQARSQYPAK